MAQTSLFTAVPLAPPDPVFQTKAAYDKDTDSDKINLGSISVVLNCLSSPGIGAYRDDRGKPWVLPSVRKAEKILAEAAPDHEYLGIGTPPIHIFPVLLEITHRMHFSHRSAGLPEFYNLARELILGQFGVKEAARVASLQTLSGTGSLRVVAEFLHEHLPGRTVYIPEPTWGNHEAVLKRSHLQQGKYRYLDQRTLGLDIAAMLEDIKGMPASSVLLLHACAHNPTGVDPSRTQWETILDVALERKLVIWFDCAYQGFASGDVAADRYAIEAACARGCELFVSQSFAKNFGIYGERAGAAHVVCSSPDQAKAVASQLALVVRPMYSNPPAYGARLVALVLGTPELRAAWETDLKTMAGRIGAMRTALRSELERLNTPGTWGHLTSQIGMFAYTGLSADQVDRLVREWHVYLLRSGRISMAGVNSHNVAYLAKAIHAVVTGSGARV